MSAASDTAGWVVSVERRKGVRPDRYYVGFADQAAAISSLRTKLGLTEEASIEVRDRLSSTDLAALKLRPGQIVKV